VGRLSPASRKVAAPGSAICSVRFPPRVGLLKNFIYETSISKRCIGRLSRIKCGACNSFQRSRRDLSWEWRYDSLFHIHMLADL
jgi:hypothetical protein